LAAVEDFDPVAREFQRIDRRGVAGFHRGLDFSRRDPQPAGVQVQPVELARRLDQGCVAARGHVVDNGAGRGLDIGRYLALGREKLREALGEIGAVTVEANRHGGFPGLNRATAQWRGDQGPSTLARLNIRVVPAKPTGRRKAPPDDRLRASRDP